MGHHIQDFATFSSKLKEMKAIKEEQEKSAKQEEYAQFFKKTLQKYGVSSPGELKDEEEKKKFFNEIDKGWEPGKGLTPDGEQTMNESHFKEGDKVKCKDSGMSGVVISLDKPHGEDDEKYYNVETETGEIIKYAPNELVKESFEIKESEISNDQEFREYAETVLKNMHGDEYDQTKADEVINGLLADKQGSDYGELIGRLNKGK